MIIIQLKQIIGLYPLGRLRKMRKGDRRLFKNRIDKYGE